MQDHQPMPEERSSRRIPVSIVAAISAVVLAAGGGTAWWTWNSARQPQPTTETPAQVEPTTPDTTTQVDPSQPEPAAPAVETTAQVYLLDVADNRFELVPSSVQLQTDGEPSAVLTAAFEQLLAGTTDSEAFSEIPSGTEIIDLSVESDGVHVNLSSEFETGGGSASMTGRLAQVIYTASTLEPTAPVWLSVEGQPLEVLGGEGLLIDQPMTRAQFEENFSL